MKIIIRYLVILGGMTLFSTASLAQFVVNGTDCGSVTDGNFDFGADTWDIQTTSPCFDFAASTRNLVIINSGDGNGVITGTVDGQSLIYCNSASNENCVFKLPQGSSIVVNGNADNSSTFDGFSSGWCNSFVCNGNGIMTNNRWLTATFTADGPPPPPPPGQHQVTVSGGGLGSGSVSAIGISCTSTAGTESGDCSQDYDEGTTIVLSASVSEGSTFGSWSGCSSTNGTSCTISNITNAANVIANFNTQTTGTCGNGTIIADIRGSWPDLAPTTAQNPNVMTPNAVESIWVKTTAAGTESGQFAIFPTSTGGQTVRVSISECSADFALADLPNQQSTCAIEGAEATLTWEEGGSNNFKCNLQPDTEYYINMTFLTAAGGSTCADLGGCSMIYEMF